LIIHVKNSFKIDDPSMQIICFKEFSTKLKA